MIGDPLLNIDEVVSGALVKILGAFGIVGIAGIVFVWVALNVDKVQALAGAIVSLVKGISLGAGRLSTRLKVEGRANQLIDELVFRQMEHEPSMPPVRVELRLVQEASDPSIHSDGRVIVRMRDEGDTTRNVLRLVKVAAPKFLIPDARPFLEAEFCEAVDLQLIRKVARKLGPQAQRIFQTDYLTEGNFGGASSLRSLLQRFETVDGGGLFESVLLQEIAYVGMRGRDTLPDVDVLREETRRFVEYVEGLARRERGDENELVFSGRYYRVAFILLARRDVAEMGLPPYVRRLQIDVSLGAESIYVLSLTSGHTPLFAELIQAFRRITTVELRHYFRIFNRFTSETQMLALFRRSDFAPTPGAFLDRLESEGITTGSTVRSTIVAVGPKYVNLTVEGIPAQMRSTDLAWGYRGRADSFIAEGDEVTATVVGLDEGRREIQLSRKAALPSPWTGERRPIEGEIVSIRVVGVEGQSLIVHVAEFETYGIVPKESWSLPTEDSSWVDWDALTDIEANARVIEANAGHDYIRLSRRSTVVDRDTVVAKYPKGTTVVAKVLRFEANGIIVELEPGVLGWLEGSDIEVGGREFKNWRHNVVPGQGIEVSVRRYQNARERFTVELPRSRWAVLQDPG